jgi:TPR repeat protein
MTRLALAIAVAIIFVSPDASAIPRSDCPKGTSWDIAAGACVKKKVAARASAQERFEKASDDIEGRGKAPDPKRGLAALEQTCGEKHGASCRLLGFLYVRGRAPAIKDDRKAADYFAKGCSVNDLESCVDVGDLAVRTGDYPKARIAFQHGCELGSGVACARDADLLDRGLGGAKDTATAAPLFKKALDKLTPQCPVTGISDGAACAWLGWMHEHGKGTAKDLGKAVTAFKSGCTAGHGEACMSLGRALDEGFGGVKDTAGANKAYDRACTDFDNADACQKIGERLGMAKQDLPRAFKLAERGCQLDPKYCGTLAEFYRLGFGIDTGKDQVKATANYKKACDNGGLGWCQNYGERAATGNGTTRDLDSAIVALEKACLGRYMGSCGVGARYLMEKDEHARAAKLAKQGCDDNDADSCYRLGRLHEAGNGGVDKSAETALTFFDKACKGDSPIGCNAQANFYNEGTGVAADKAKAFELYQKACEGNASQLFSPACTSAAQMAFWGNGVPKDQKLGLKLMQRACEYREADTCKYLQSMITQTGGKLDEITKTLEESCNAGNHEACHAHAEILWTSERETDRRLAYTKFEQLCKASYANGCLRQADQLLYGRGVTKDPDKAEALYRTQCDAGNSFGCQGLGSLYHELKKHEEAHRMFLRSCEGGSPDGCMMVGWGFKNARGVAWDMAQGAKFYQKACELQSQTGCNNLASLYFHGTGVKRDHKKAYELYDKVCTATASSLGCGGLARYLWRGEGGHAIDLPRAEAMYRKACSPEDPDPEACAELAQLLDQLKKAPAEAARLRQSAFNQATKYGKEQEQPYYMYVLGLFHRDGVATLKDPVKSLEWFSKACDGFNSLGCVQAGKQLRTSKQAADLDRARVYFERACAAGDEDACAQSKAPGPTPVAGGKGCCSGEIAPGAEAGLIVVLWVMAGRVRRRRQKI